MASVSGGYSRLPTGTFCTGLIWPPLRGPFYREGRGQSSSLLSICGLRYSAGRLCGSRLQIRDETRVGTPEITGEAGPAQRVDRRTPPDRCRRWRPTVEGRVARLALAAGRSFMRDGAFAGSNTPPSAIRSPGPSSTAARRGSRALRIPAPVPLRRRTATRRRRQGPPLQTLRGCPITPTAASAPRRRGARLTAAPDAQTATRIPPIAMPEARWGR